MNNFVGFSRHSNQINCMGFSRHSNFINNVGKTHPVSMDHWMQIKERSENAKDVIKEYDNATKVLGKKPTPEQILEMARYKGVTYQRKGNGNTTKTDQNIPKAITPPTSELNIDLGSWVSNAKVLVPSSKTHKNTLLERKVNNSYRGS
jgi:hypothetical protein